MNGSCKNIYLKKLQLYPPQIKDTPSESLNIIIVIPCYNEPGLVTTLQSLWNCAKPASDVEVIVVINAGEDAKEEVLRQNELTLQQTSRWIDDHQDDHLKFYLLDFSGLPKKHAGVGLARKIGMDEAVSRFEDVTPESGIIVCLDADCTCEKNYLKSISEHFLKYPKTSACSIYFEHPIEGNEIPDPYLPIIQYELFLRYYVQALRYAGHPFAFHTVGSSMAVRNITYQEQGGMNRRKGGEDFYFLQKLISLGNFSELNTTTVFPSGRPSDRVIFGTGRAINEIQRTKEMMKVYHPNTFFTLKKLFESVPEFYLPENEHTIEAVINSFPLSLSSFLFKEDIQGKLSEINNNCASIDTFTNRFFRWFNGFKALKYAHYCRDHYFKPIPLFEAATELLNKSENNSIPLLTLKDLLLYFRKRDRLVKIHGGY